MIRKSYTCPSIPGLDIGGVKVHELVTDDEHTQAMIEASASAGVITVEVVAGQNDASPETEVGTELVTDDDEHHPRRKRGK